MASKSRHSSRSRRNCQHPESGAEGYRRQTAIHAELQSRAKINNNFLRRTQERLASLAPKKEEARDESEK